MTRCFQKPTRFDTTAAAALPCILMRFCSADVEIGLQYWNRSRGRGTHKTPRPKQVQHEKVGTFVAWRHVPSPGSRRTTSPLDVVLMLPPAGGTPDLPPRSSGKRLPAAWSSTPQQRRLLLPFWMTHPRDGCSLCRVEAAAPAAGPALQAC